MVLNTITCFLCDTINYYFFTLCILSFVLGILLKLFFPKKSLVFKELHSKENKEEEEIYDADTDLKMIFVCKMDTKLNNTYIAVQTADLSASK
jgi:hypothetical protein